MNSSRWLERIDGLAPVRFTALLYLLRWIVLLPVMGVARLLLGPGQENEGMASMLRERDLLELARELLVVAPLYETVLECSIPYLALRFLLRRRGELAWRRPWFFIGAAAMVMVLLHPLEPQVIVATTITGLFLGYTYGHFAAHGHGRAIVATAAFHAGINLVGFSLLAYAKVTGAGT